MTRLVSSWQKAWTAKDLDRFLSFYSDDFNTGGKDRDAWGEHKSNVFRNSGAIRVEIGRLVVESDGALAVVEFEQAYSSESHTDHGVKTLVLEKHGAGYRIKEETWRPLD